MVALVLALGLAVRVRVRVRASVSVLGALLVGVDISNSVQRSVVQVSFVQLSFVQHLCAVFHGGADYVCTRSSR